MDGKVGWELLSPRIVRIGVGGLVSGVLLATPLAAVPGLSTPASASTPMIVCSQAKGNLGGDITFKRCTGNTGGSSRTQLSSTVLGGSATISWVSGKVTGTTVSQTVVGQGSCPVGNEEYVISGIVEVDTTGSAQVGGIVKGKLCVTTSTGNFKVLAGTTYKFK
jgi:hypothetical protein